MSGLLVIGLAPIAVGQETTTQPVPRSGISGRMCKELIRQGYGVKCVKGEVTYGATSARPRARAPGARRW
jgi:hypothetical protein